MRQDDTHARHAEVLALLRSEAAGALKASAGGVRLTISDLQRQFGLGYRRAAMPAERLDE
jgi:DNA segregation ATPase FtsK/SpoIIIE-like protein